ncbi:MAG: Mrp/NBP35 family ATP-binding protein [Clostridia bacterium]|nr:Mrp/NBP35 family ATP-binding protein [Clostridia bacterium]
MSECTHDCSSCAQNCSERTEENDFRAKLNNFSSVKKVIAVLSGKGGVGKSLVTSLLAVNAMRNGDHVAILDADITGPSIPNAFGVHEKATGSDIGIFPVTSKLGVDMMSINLLLENETDPVVWRGPIIAGTVKQFWTDVIWKDVDIMFIDMPPGTGDVPLTVFQSLPIDGVVVVTSPQELVGMVVQKAVNMANMMNIPVLGVVENYSYFECPDCGKRHKLFGESHIEKIAAENGVKTVCRIPINPKLAAACDAGLIELYEGDWLNDLTVKIETL